LEPFKLRQEFFDIAELSEVGYLQQLDYSNWWPAKLST
jgi:hypothetical protein